jgi:hypothetical protein
MLINIFIGDIKNRQGIDSHFAVTAAFITKEGDRVLSQGVDYTLCMSL